MDEKTIDKIVEWSHVLPSSEEWRTQFYSRQVEELRIEKQNHFTMLVPAQPTDIEYGRRESCHKQTKAKAIKGTSTIYWDDADIRIAADLMTECPKPPIKLLADTERMRSVSFLIYDVLRFKSVIIEALQNIGFYKQYPSLLLNQKMVWLIGFDFFRREFNERPEKLEDDPHRLRTIDECLWSVRVPLAASVSRVRIRKNANDYENLLPNHLRAKNCGFHGSTRLVGWINLFKTSIEYIMTFLENQLGLEQLTTGEEKISLNGFVDDHLVPRLLHIYLEDSKTFLKSEIVKNQFFIVQHKSLCFGAVVFSHLLHSLCLNGYVAQSHITTPTASAYLASLLSRNKRIKKLWVFGAGQRKEEFSCYFDKLGVSNIRLFKETFTESVDKGHLFDTVTAILACPPSSNSALTNPVDFAIARGGEIQVLYSLARESEQIPAQQYLLQEQKNTLIKAMSKPQVQLIAYETYSRSSIENEDMVAAALKEFNSGVINEYGRKLIQTLYQKDESAPPLDTQTVMDEKNLLQDVLKQVHPGDLFEVCELPKLCSKNCWSMRKEGIYVCAIRRKVVTPIDAKYLIDVAASRGLFGKKDGKREEEPQDKPQVTHNIRKKSIVVKCSKAQQEKALFERISAPTQCSIMRMQRGVSPDCPRCATHHHQFADAISVVMEQYWQQHFTEDLSTLLSFNKLHIPFDCKSSHPHSLA